MPELLSDTQIENSLVGLEGWRRADGALRRTIESPSFLAAIALVQRVAQAAEHLDHHPDMDIRWRRVTFTCSTHSAGGVTELDLLLARQINDLATAP